jgi:hypothetical protein
VEDERRHPLTDEDIERIAEAVARKASAAFHIGEEEHYNSHKRLDKLIDVYDSAQSAFWKAFIAIVIVGALVLAGIGITRGAK